MIKQFTVLFLLLSVACYGQNKKDTTVFLDTLLHGVSKDVFFSDGEFTVDEMPSFPGGDEQMRDFIKKNIIYPASEKDGEVQGTVIVSFVIETDGSISNVKILRGVSGGPGCDKEAMRVVRAMPNWLPAKEGGVPVRVEAYIPIIFKMK